MHTPARKIECPYIDVTVSICACCTKPRPKKEIMSVSSDMSKNIRAGRSEKSFILLLFFSKEVMTKLFFQPILLLLHLNNSKTVQIGNRCGLWGILCSTNDKTANLSQR